MKKIYKSRVTYDVVARVFEELGATIQYDGSEVLLPSGEYVLIFPAEDGGTHYMLPSCGEDTIRFVQRVFARANLIVKKFENKPQAQNSEIDSELEEKEERKKGTSEVSEFVSGTSDSVHGGDSVSGEVPEAESGKGQDNSSSKEPALPQQEAGSGQEEETASSQPRHLSPDGGSSSSTREDKGGESCSSDSSSSEAPSSSGDEEGAGESGASDRSELERASEEAGSSEDGACPKDSECSAVSQVDELDASIDGQASIGEGTGSHAPSAEDLIDEIIGEESGESSTLPSSGGAFEFEGFEGEAPELEREVSPSLSYKELRKIMSRGFATPPSAHSNNSFGGVFGKLELIKDPPSQSLITRARRVFSRLVSSYGEGLEGPRWDYKKVSTRIASYQIWKNSDRKLEIGRPAIAVFSDISGSMDLFAEEVLKVAKILMRLGVSGCEVIAVCHSNGYPCELWVNGKKVEELSYKYSRDDDYAMTWYEKVFTKYNVRILVLAADWDGAWLYKRFAEDFSSVEKIYWLDVYEVSQNKGPVLTEFPPKWGQFVWSSEALGKIVYVCNCQDAEDFVRGLELMIATLTKLI